MALPTGVGSGMALLMPKALNLPSPDEMRAANEELSRRDAALKKT